jgi:hypothetical protein
MTPGSISQKLSKNYPKIIGLSHFDIHRRPGEGRGPVKMQNYSGSRPPPGRRGL